jgi:hypothetical protein
MIRTAVIFGVLIVAVVALLPKGHHAKDPARAIDYSGELQIVRNRAPFPVLAPEGLDSTWTPTHVTIAVPQNGSTVTTFDLGFYVSGPNAYVNLEQSDASGWVTKQLGPKAHQNGSAQVTAGAQAVSYATWTDADGHPALTATLGTSTIVIRGVASEAVLRTFAASLRSPSG